MTQLLEMLKLSIAHGSTVRQIAERAGVSRQFIYNMLDGTNVPNIVTAEKIANAIGCELQVHSVSTGKKSQKVPA